MKTDFRKWAEATTLAAYVPYLTDGDVSQAMMRDVSLGTGHFTRAFAIEETQSLTMSGDQFTAVIDTEAHKRMGRLAIPFIDTNGEPIRATVFQLDVVVAKPRTMDSILALRVDDNDATLFEIDRKNCVAFRRPPNAQLDKRTGLQARIETSDPCFGIVCYRKVE